MSDTTRLLTLLAVFAPLSILSFGGGQSTIPEMQRQVVAVHGFLTDAQFAELMAVVGLANETNRLANGYDVPVDDRFLQM